MLGGLVSQEVVELALVLFLSLLVGIEREEHKAHVAHRVFGGVRTFPLLGFVGYGLARLCEGNVVALAIGFAVVGGLMAVSYAYKVRADPSAGATTEVSGMLVYVVGALVHAGDYWLAVTLGVLAVLLLELREWLERLTTKVGPEEVTAFAKFLVLATVILPILPDRPFSRFAINPYRSWLVLVAVSGLSYASYVLQRGLKERGGVVLTALLGGAYSSTATTAVLAKQARETQTPWLYAGSILAASGMMYARIIVLVFLFDAELARALAPGFGVLAALAIGVGVTLALRRGAGSSAAPRPRSARNPLELRPVFVFGAAFVVVVVLTRLAIEYLGRAGLYGLAALTGLTDVDPFVLGLAHLGASAEPVHVAASAVVVAASANNLAKGAYALWLGGKPAGRVAFALLAGLAVAGLVPLAFC